MLKPEERCKEYVHPDYCSRRRVEGNFCKQHAVRNDREFQDLRRAHERSLWDARGVLRNVRYTADAYHAVKEHLIEHGIPINLDVTSGCAIAISELQDAKQKLEKLEQSAPVREVKS